MSDVASTGALIGYARISTGDQSLQLQLDALEAAGCIKIFTDVASGAKADRPGLADAIAFMRPGDLLCCWKMDRIARSTPHMVSLLEDFKSKGFGFKSLTEQIDTSSPMGEFFYILISALGALERGILRERTRAGLEAARARGKTPGRKPSLTADQVELIQKLVAEGKQIKTVAEMFKVSRPTIYRALERAG